MKNAIILIVIIALIIVGYLVFKNKGEEEQTPIIETATTTPAVEPIRVSVALAAKNKSGESGTAVLENIDGKLKVTLSLSGAPEGVSQPVHIHIGSCAKLGDPKYTLTNVVGGNSETLLDTISVEQILAGLPFAINIHKSEKEIGKYVACGDIVNPNTPIDTATSTSPTTATSTATTTR
mgnify:CR=1 FL=1